MKPSACKSQAAPVGLAGRPRGGGAWVSAVATDPAHRRIRNAAGVGRLPGSRASLSHRTSGLYLRNAAVPALRGHLRENRAADHRGREFDHCDARDHRQPGQSARRGVYAAAQQSDAVPARRVSVPVLRRALHLQPAVAGPRDAVQPRRARYLEQRGVGVPPLQQRQGVADAGAGGHAAAWRCRSRRPTPSTSS